MPSTPPISPQCHQEAAHHAEDFNHLIASPKQHRTPTGPSATSTSAPPPLSISQALARGPVIFGRQRFDDLLPNLTAQVGTSLSLCPLAPRQLEKINISIKTLGNNYRYSMSSQLW